MRIDLLKPDGHFRTLDDIEAEIIEHAVAHYGFDMSETARRLAIGRSTLYRKTEKRSKGRPE